MGAEAVHIMDEQSGEFASKFLSYCFNTRETCSLIFSLSLSHFLMSSRAEGENIWNLVLESAAAFRDKTQTAAAAPVARGSEDFYFLF